jgi:hypothetical protein
MDAPRVVHLDWEEVDPDRWAGWGNGQIEDNEDILSRYQAQLEDPRYLHAAEGLQELLGY